MRCSWATASALYLLEYPTEKIPCDAADLLNGLLSENVDPTNHQCVQIGGEFLHAYDSANLASNPDILGRTPI